ncbi:hypothetical protein M0812_20122 [Anaeramoeba flamelloides]|uniref:Mutator-like transposase domain-containing protein n=1 Tax=Anaeramoeba flamelloides TaxID=1746091 RepID=A0AAV7YW78_9EUKA|nr:hypothetical protein M0812_20122 [Anaeramoeba flamelloides]
MIKKNKKGYQLLFKQLTKRIDSLIKANALLKHRLNEKNKKLRKRNTEFFNNKKRITKKEEKQNKEIKRFKLKIQRIENKSVNNISRKRRFERMNLETIKKNEQENECELLQQEQNLKKNKNNQNNVLKEGFEELPTLEIESKLDENYEKEKEGIGSEYKKQKNKKIINQIINEINEIDCHNPVFNYNNYQYSSKSFESFLSLKSFRILTKLNVFPRGIIHDRDAPTLKQFKLLSEINKSEVIEINDPNHWVKNVISIFEKLINSNKSQSFKLIITKNRIKIKLIKKLKKWIYFCLKNNFNNSNKFIFEVSNCFDHWSGDHKNCSKNICIYLDKNLNDKKSNFFKIFENEWKEGINQAKEELIKIIKPPADKILTGYHTNYVESFNNLITKFSPKSTNLSSTYPLQIYLALLN